MWWISFPITSILSCYSRPKYLVTNAVASRFTRQGISVPFCCVGSKQKALLEFKGRESTCACLTNIKWQKSSFCAYQGKKERIGRAVFTIIYFLCNLWMGQIR